MPVLVQDSFPLGVDWFGQDGASSLRLERVWVSTLWLLEDWTGRPFLGRLDRGVLLAGCWLGRPFFSRLDRGVLLAGF